MPPAASSEERISCKPNKVKWIRTRELSLLFGVRVQEVWDILR
jgi:hypothetical protein